MISKNIKNILVRLLCIAPITILLLRASDPPAESADTTGIHPAEATRDPGPAPTKPKSLMEKDMAILLQETIQRGLEFQMLNQYDRALVKFRLAQKISAKAKGINYQIAICLFNQKDLAGAKLEAETSITKGEVEADSKNLLGVIAGMKEQHEEALSLFREATKLIPNNDQYYLNISESLRRLGRVQEAIPYLEKAIRLKPQDPIYGFKLRIVRLSLGDVGSIRKEIEEQFQLASPSGDWLLIAAADQILQNNLAKAATLMDEARRVMSPPIFIGMLQDPVFMLKKDTPEIRDFYQFEITEFPVDKPTGSAKPTDK